MNESARWGSVSARVAPLVVLLALAGCGGGGEVSGTIANADDTCALPKATLTHGIAYVDASLLDSGVAPKIEVVLSDRSLSAIDIEKGFNPLFGAEAKAKQLFVLISLPLHGAAGREVSFMHPEKRCSTNLSSRDVHLALLAFTPERVALRATQPPAAEGATGERDEAVFTADLPIQWPKATPAKVRETMLAEIAAARRFEREAVAMYQELAKAVAAHDVAGVEKRVSTEGWSGFGGLLEEMVFGAPDEHDEVNKFLPTVAELKPASHLIAREASKADTDWELLLALCDPADAARRGVAYLERKPDGTWQVRELRDADNAREEFGPAPGACTALAPPA